MGALRTWGIVMTLTNTKLSNDWTSQVSGLIYPLDIGNFHWIWCFLYTSSQWPGLVPWNSNIRQAKFTVSFGQDLFVCMCVCVLVRWRHRESPNEKSVHVWAIPARSSFRHKRLNLPLHPTLGSLVNKRVFSFLIFNNWSLMETACIDFIQVAQLK
jgi:hypothetical protein